jgi:hypothetical protein
MPLPARLKDSLIQTMPKLTEATYFVARVLPHGTGCSHH